MAGAGREKRNHTTNKSPIATSPSRKRDDCNKASRIESKSCRSMRGFHSTENQHELAKLVKSPCFPKPGCKQAAAANLSFRDGKQQHRAIRQR